MHETPTPGSARPVRLTFLTVTGEKLSVDTKPTDTLPVVRRRIELEHSIAANTQKLMLGDEKMLEGKQTMADRGIGPGSELRLALHSPDHMTVERTEAVTEAEARTAERAEAARERVEALSQQQPFHMLLHGHDGVAKHRRWFRLSRDEASGAVTMSWGKKQDGSNHMLWASCGSAPPKSRDVSGVDADAGPAGAAYGFAIQCGGTGSSGLPVLVSADSADVRYDDSQQPLPALSRSRLSAAKLHLTCGWICAVSGMYGWRASGRAKRTS